MPPAISGAVTGHDTLAGKTLFTFLIPWNRLTRHGVLDRSRFRSETFGQSVSLLLHILGVLCFALSHDGVPLSRI
jgi:hypothetical protein